MKLGDKVEPNDVLAALLIALAAVVCSGCFAACVRIVRWAFQ